MVKAFDVTITSFKFYCNVIDYIASCKEYNLVQVFTWPPYKVSYAYSNERLLLDFVYWFKQSSVLRDSKSTSTIKEWDRNDETWKQYLYNYLKYYHDHTLNAQNTRIKELPRT